MEDCHNWIVFDRWVLVALVFRCRKAVLFYIIGPCIWIHNFGMVWPVVFVYKSGWCARILNFRCFFWVRGSNPPGRTPGAGILTFRWFFFVRGSIPPSARVWLWDIFLGLRATIASHERPFSWPACDDWKPWKINPYDETCRGQCIFRRFWFISRVWVWDIFSWPACDDCKPWETLTMKHVGANSCHEKPLRWNM